MRRGTSSLLQSRLLNESIRRTHIGPVAGEKRQDLQARYRWKFGEMPRKVAVIGAGVIGLSTAVQVQESMPGADVTIIADKLNEETVSDGAAGLFRPTLDYIPGVPRPLLKQWSKDSFDRFSNIAHSDKAVEQGIGIVSGYHFFSKGAEEKDSLYREVVFDFRNLRKDELGLYPGTEHCSSGYFYTTVIVECRWYLPWLMKQFRLHGGTLEVRTVHDFSEFVGKYDVVVNCTGEASQRLLGDTKMKPTRGQMIRVSAPWLKHFLYVDHECWVIPGKETATVGGTRQERDDNMQIVKRDSEQIWERACTHVPSLKAARWEWQWVGRRPIRVPVRVEKETLHFGAEKLQVVHNYGHGGNGVSLSWGCGRHATRLVQELLDSTQPAKL